MHPAPSSGINNCSEPGIVAGDDGEAILDAEWASAAAPSAAIVVAACGNTRITFGGFIAMQNIVNAAAPPSIISISYGNCEAENGAASNASINALYQQAVAEGISVFVAAGDEGAASCDAGRSSATHGIGVSAYASTPYNVAVGGTDFSDTVDGTNGNYWSTTNTSTYGSAFVLHSGNSVERFLRGQPAGQLSGLRHRLWHERFLQQQHGAAETTGGSGRG